MNPRDIEAIILAGRSTRLKDKAFIKINNKEIFRYGYEVLEEIFKEVKIICNKQVCQKFFPLAINIIEENLNIGPLGAIYVGMNNTKSGYVAVFACDMPFLNKDLIEFLCSKVTGDGIVPLNDRGQIEPLHAIYKREEVLNVLDSETLEEGGRIQKMLDRLDMRYIQASEIKKFDPELLSFRNINTKDDLKWMMEFLHDR